MLSGSEFSEPVFDGWHGGRPKTLADLFVFYHGYVKPLYAEVQTENELPQEVLFELNAALDHLARHWTYQETEEMVVAKAYSHFKRACLDVFKIRLVKAVDQRNRLFQTDLSAVDNGDFIKELNALFAKIQRGAVEARQTEGMPDNDNKVPAFEMWEAVFLDCIKLEEKFFLHKGVNWARQRGWLIWCRQNFIGFVLGILASLIASYVYAKMTASSGSNLTVPTITKSGL